MTEVESKRLPGAETAAASDAELRQYVRTNLIRTLVVLVLLFGGLALVGVFFEAQLLATAEAVYQAVGVAGLLAILFLSDVLISPVPPDVVLVVIANSSLHEHWVPLLLAVGMLSCLAGNVGWAIGYRFAQFRWANRWIQGLRDKYAGQIHRFDRWSIALGAMTPLPFSLMCITAGALGMRWERIAPVTLLRIPRFYLTYLVIASSSIF